jgi:hypothetical protein
MDDDGVHDAGHVWRNEQCSTLYETSREQLQYDMVGARNYVIRKSDLLMAHITAESQVQLFSELSCDSYCAVDQRCTYNGRQWRSD